VRGSGLSIVRNPLTPTLSPNGEREHTVLVVVIRNGIQLMPVASS
jgi:hypothetical protein